MGEDFNPPPTPSPPPPQPPTLPIRYRRQYRHHVLVRCRSPQEVQRSFLQALLALLRRRPRHRLRCQLRTERHVPIGRVEERPPQHRRQVWWPLRDEETRWVESDDERLGGIEPVKHILARSENIFPGPLELELYHRLA